MKFRSLFGRRHADDDVAAQLSAALTAMPHAMPQTLRAPTPDERKAVDRRAVMSPRAKRRKPADMRREKQRSIKLTPGEDAEIADVLSRFGAPAGEALADIVLRAVRAFYLAPIATEDNAATLVDEIRTVRGRSRTKGKSVS